MVTLVFHIFVHFRSGVATVILKLLHAPLEGNYYRALGPHRNAISVSRNNLRKYKGKRKEVRNSMYTTPKHLWYSRHKSNVMGTTSAGGNLDGDVLEVSELVA
jgi:hypothetical protein